VRIQLTDYVTLRAQLPPPPGSPIPPTTTTTQITDVGCTALARAAKEALVLSRLDVSHNLTTGATLLALAEGLRFNTGAFVWVWVWVCGGATVGSL
jgi:hypothetical protein